MSEIEPGVPVLIRDAFGEWLRRRALTGVIQGADFPVVWACREEEWAAAHAEGASLTRCRGQPRTFASL